MLEFEEERLVAKFDGYIEDFTFNLFFRIERSIDDILTLHLNSGEYGETTCQKDFSSYDFFPKFSSGDFYLISSVLSKGIPSEIRSYFDRALSIYKKVSKKDTTYDIHTMQIKFSDTSYLTFNEIIKKVNNAFLNLLPKKKILEFSKELIFTCNYDATPYEFFTKKTSINYTALVYLIQKDLTAINFTDLDLIKNDVFNIQIQFNPFFDTQSNILNKIKKDFYRLGKIKINNSKTGNKYEKLNRIYEIYLMTTYPTIYFQLEDKAKLTIKDIYSELTKLGHSYESNYNDDNINASKHQRQIQRDLDLIEDIKQVEIPFDLENYNGK